MWQINTKQHIILKGRKDEGFLNIWTNKNTPKIISIKQPCVYALWKVPFAATAIFLVLLQLAY